MSRFLSAANNIKTLNEMGNADRWMNRLHPLVKLFVTIFFMVVVVSHSRYSILELSGMGIYLILLYMAAPLSVIDAIRRFFVVLPFVVMVGLFNPVFDRVPIVILGISTTTGVISMITLILKGVFTLLASYSLIATTGMDRICYALRLIHVPSVVVTEILLIYRYIILLLEENHRVMEAYSLRAPGQKGVNIRAWGSLTGLILLRSMDRAKRLYEAMLLRGYTGDFIYQGRAQSISRGDVIYLAASVLIIAGLRVFPVFAMLV